jgi:NADPH2 dehydrogenase
MPDSRLFQPLKVGTRTLSYRLAMAPLTRFRADDNRMSTPYKQCSSPFTAVSGGSHSLTPLLPRNHAPS